MNSLYRATILLVFLVPAVLAACEPDCTGKKVGDPVEDPLSCSRYYICMAGEVPTDQPVSCTAGEEFNPTTGLCGKPATPPCVPSCIVPDCHMTCSGADPEFIRNPLDCSEYSVCSHGEVISTFTCTAPTLYFDGAECVEDPTVCCSDLCVPYCHKDMVQTPDPVNCTSYYICLAVGLVDETYHYQCPANSFFDIPTGRCLEDTSCVTLCSGRDTDGSSAITTAYTTSATSGVSTGTTHSTSTTPGATDSTTTNTGTTDSTTPSTGTTPAPGTTSTDSTATPTTPSTPPTTTTADPNGCVEQFKCPDKGSFPRCAVCDEHYFECTAAGELGVLQTCMQGFLFNTNPALPYCVVADACPFSP